MSPRAIIGFLFVVLVWGTTWFVIKDQLATVNASWSVTYRFAVGAAVLILWCLWKGIPLGLTRAALPFAVLLGLLQFVLNFNFVYRSELYIPSGIPAVAFALLMIPNAFFGWLFLKRRVSARFAMGAALGVVGVGLMFLHQLALPGDRADTMLGLLLVGCAILSASLANVMQAAPRATAIPPMAMLAWAMLIGTIINALLALGLAGLPQWDARPQYLLGILYLGIFGSAIAFAVYFALIRDIGPAEAAWTGVPIPIVAMAISTVAEGYRWTPLAAGGAALALAGLIVALWQPKGHSR